MGPHGTEEEIATNTDPARLWSLVVPLKPLRAGQEQARRAAAGDARRPRLALAFAQDTVAAALACPAVRDVVVVTDDPAGRGGAGGARRPDRARRPGGAGSTPRWRTGRASVRARRAATPRWRR